MYGTQGLFLVYGLPSLYNIVAYATGLEILSDYIIVIHVLKYICLVPMLYYFFTNKDVSLIATVSAGFMIIMLAAGINFGKINGTIIGAILYYVAYTMVIVICLSLLKEPEIIMQKFRSIAYIGCAEIVVMCLFGNILHIYSKYTDYMVMGNSGLVYISALVYWALKEKKLLDVILSGIVVVCYLLFTSRGSLGALAVVILYYIMFGNIGVLLKKRVVWITILSSFGLIFVVNLKTILRVVANVVTELGWGMGKLLQSFLYFDNIFQSLGRMEIWGNIIGFFKERWFIGYGPMASVKLTGGYAHNMELDILLDYGIVLGGMFILYIWVVLVNLLFGKRYRQWANVCAIFVLPGFLVLQLSGYWYSTSYIFILFYLFLMARKDSRKKVWENGDA